MTRLDRSGYAATGNPTAWTTTASIRSIRSRFRPTRTFRSAGSAQYARISRKFPISLDFPEKFSYNVPVMQRMILKTFRGDVRVALVQVVPFDHDESQTGMAKAIVMFDPFSIDDLLRVKYGISEENPYALVSLLDLRPVPEDYNRIFGK